jgi:hypothetical protein
MCYSLFTELFEVSWIWTSLLSKITNSCLLKNTPIIIIFRSMLYYRLIFRIVCVNTFVFASTLIGWLFLWYTNRYIHFSKLDPHAPCFRKIVSPSLGITCGDGEITLPEALRFSSQLCWKYTWPKVLTPAARWTSHSKVMGINMELDPPFAALTASILLGRLSTRCWKIAAGTCFHSATRALVRSSD